MAGLRASAVYALVAPTCDFEPAEDQASKKHKKLFLRARLKDSNTDSGHHFRNQLDAKHDVALAAWSVVLSGQGEEVLKFVKLYQLHPLPLPW